MLTEKDYIQYLRQIREVEERMESAYRACFAEIEDDILKRALRKLIRAEKRHGDLVEVLMRGFPAS